MLTDDVPKARPFTSSSTSTFILPLHSPLSPSSNGMSGQLQTRQRKGYGRGLGSDSDNGDSVHEIVPARSVTSGSDRSPASEHGGYGPARHTPQRYSRTRYTESTRFSLIVASALFILALAFRFYKINHPDQVVFDEVHFG
ncbi:hypothetical protein FRB95_001009, partial [Tulasnella sp. JGI-2019a]